MWLPAQMTVTTGVALKQVGKTIYLLTARDVILIVVFVFDCHAYLSLAECFS